ncbi:MAG: hypothetical protein JO257_04820 [Deltaproteobacteria bacterium]|nr:hypothetical protein [Deltaproteobacteria bacterium]
MKRVLACIVIAGCGKLQGFSGDVPPLATIEVTATGSPPVNADLRVALVWGRQWLVEPLCLEGSGGLPLDPRDDPNAVAAVIAAGCRDPFGFVPARDAADAPLTIGMPASLELITLPGADVMVGDLTARVAYGSLVVYDDQNHDGTLNIAVPNRPPDFGGEGGGGGGGMGSGSDDTMTKDVVVGASFVTMLDRDTRVTYREGAFIQSGFYPRAGCDAPPPGFSIDAASGFTRQAAIDATLMGTVPQETDLSQCVQRAPATGPVTVALTTPSRTLQELACRERNTDSTVRYREPDAQAPDLTDRTTACVHHPSFGMPSDVIEFVVAGRTQDSCVGLTHYILKGCREGPDCGTPDWDHSLAPPSWWPC